MDKETEILNALHDHTVDDEVRFKKIFDLLEGMDTKLDSHIEKVEPFVQGAAGFGIIWKVLMAVGGLLVIWVQIKSLFGK